MRTNKQSTNSKFQQFLNRNGGFIVCVFVAVLLVSCTKEIKVDIPDSAQQVVVDGTIENNVPPVIMLTKSQKFFSTVDLNEIGNYFVHGATIKVRSSEGDSVVLQEFCFQNLGLPKQQEQELLSAFGFTTADSGTIPNICVYTVPDILAYITGGHSSFEGKEQTIYGLDIIAPPFTSGDSIHLTASTYIPHAIGLDSLTLREHPNPDYRDSMMAVYANFSVPDTFGNFIRYKTKRNDEAYYTPLGGSVYDDKLFVGLTVSLPIERGQPVGSDFDINTDSYFWRGDTVTVKWSNIDKKTYDFYYTLENDGGGSPFSQYVRIKSNISNGLGVWAGYGTKYSRIIVPQK